MLLPGRNPSSPIVDNPSGTFISSHLPRFIGKSISTIFGFTIEPRKGLKWLRMSDVRRYWISRDLLPYEYELNKSVLNTDQSNKELTNSMPSANQSCHTLTGFNGFTVQYVFVRLHGPFLNAAKSDFSGGRF